MSPLSKVANFYWLLLLVSIALFLPLQNALTHLLGLSTFIDEILQFFMLVVLLFYATKNVQAKMVIKFYTLIVIGMALLSIRSIPERGIFNVALQIFIHSKFIIYIGFFYLVVKKEIAQVAINIVIILSIFFLFFDLVSQGVLHSLLEQKIQLRGGSVRPIGIQGHTANLGFFMSMLAAYLISKDESISQKVKFAFILFSIILILLTTVRTALVVFPIILAWGLRSSFKVTASTCAVIGLFFITFGSNKYLDDLVEITQNNIINTVENPTKAAYIRGMMIYFSFELANERFPFGTGAATFGTVTSDDSSIYAELGVRKSRFFVEKDGIYDSNFASILGEFGYFGLIAYSSIFVIFLMKLTASNRSKYKINSEFLFVSTSLTLVYSFTNPVFMNTHQIIILALFLSAASFKNANAV